MDNYQVDLREKEMEELQNSPPEGIYFDGKKDDTLALEKDERAKGVWKVVQYKEEHYTRGVEPFGKYLGHLEPDSGKAVVGSDSTSCITGIIGGVICLLEKV